MCGGGGGGGGSLEDELPLTAMLIKRSQRPRTLKHDSVEEHMGSWLMPM